MILASAPATIMLLGEHAVLRGGAALASALDARIYLELRPRKDRFFTINSALGKYKGHLDGFEVQKPFHFILEGVRAFSSYFEQGFDLKLRSDFSHQIGFGSSAAVTAASLGAFNLYTKQGFSLEKLAEIGKKITQKIQIQASGMDVMTSLLGGILFYAGDAAAEDAGRVEHKLQKLAIDLPLEIIYSGYKLPTSEVLALVKDRPFDYRVMKHITFEGKKALERDDFAAFGEAMQAYQMEMRKLGLETKEIAAILARLEKDAGIRAAKISGSGLGDSVIGLGKLEKPFDWCRIHPRAARVTISGTKRGLDVRAI